MTLLSSTESVVYSLCVYRCVVWIIYAEQMEVYEKSSSEVCTKNSLRFYV